MLKYNKLSEKQVQIIKVILLVVFLVLNMILLSVITSQTSPQNTIHSHFL